MSDSYSFVCNAKSGNVLDVFNNGISVGDRVIIWGRKKSGTQNQLWKFEDGFLINLNSGFVLEAPLVDGVLQPKTALIQAEKRAYGGGNQRWTHDEKSRLVCELDTTLCIWGQDGNVQGTGQSAIVDTVVDGNISQEWRFDASA